MGNSNSARCCRCVAENHCENVFQNGGGCFAKSVLKTVLKTAPKRGPFYTLNYPHTRLVLGLSVHRKALDQPTSNMYVQPFVSHLSYRKRFR